MDINRKLEIVVAQLENLASHDDAPIEEVQSALDAVAQTVTRLRDTLSDKREDRLSTREMDADILQEQREASRLALASMSAKERRQRMIRLHAQAIDDLKTQKE